MPVAMRLLRRLRRLRHAADVERSMNAEFQHHLECAIAERVAAGMAPEAARRAAVLEFGAIERFKEEGRDARGTRALDDAWRDAAYGVRVMRAHPAFTCGVVATFALAIATATAILSVVYGVLLRPLPYAAPERLVALWERDLAHDRDRNVVSLANFEAWRQRATMFSGMAALVPRPGTVGGGAAAERVAGAEVTAGYFTLLGIAPALGRDLRPGDTTAVVVSDAFWRRRLGGVPAAIGRSIEVDAAHYTVVGVMPAGFEPPRFGWLGEQDAWFLLVPSDQARSWGRFLVVVARLRRNVTVDLARAQLAGIARQLERDIPGNRGWSASVFDLREEIAGNARPLLLAASAAVVLLLVLTICNVAMLTLSFVRRRGHELAIRRAIGATEGRLFRQLLTQSVMLGALGTAAGIVMALPALRILLWLLPSDTPRLADVALDVPVLVMSMGVATLATLAFGVLGAARAGVEAEFARVDGSPRVSARGTGGRVVALETAFVLALVVLALLASKSLARLLAVDVGFDPAGVIAARLSLPPSYAGPDRQRAFFERLRVRMDGAPGVLASGVITTRPFGGLGPATSVFDPAAPPVSPGDAPVADARYADAGFFTAMRIAFVAGGPCGDRAASVLSERAVVNEALVRAIWPGRSGVGRRLHVELFGGRLVEVCGVTRDVHLMDARTPARPTVYLPFSAFPSEDADLVVRTANERAESVRTLRAVVADLDPSLPVYAVDAMDAIVDRSVAADRFATFLTCVFAAAALLLAVVGVFSVVLADASARRREIGIRLALGGRPWAVVHLFLRRALVRAAGGVAAGMVLAAFIGRLTASLLYGVSPADPAAYAGGALLVTAVTILAAVAPVWIALRRAPLEALREG